MIRRWFSLVPAVLLVLSCAGCEPEPPDETDTVPAAESPASMPDPETVRRVQTELNAAGRLMQQGKFDEALETASAAIALAPHRIEPYEVLSNWYIQLKRHDRAIEAFERLSAQGTHGLRFLARHQALTDDHVAALDTLDRCIETDARQPHCRFERARLRRANGAFGGAADDLRVAYGIDSDPLTAARLAEVLRITGAYSEIGAIVDAALASSPDSTGLLLARARQQIRDRNDAAAEQTLRRVVELDPTSHVALRMLGGLLLRVGQQAEGSYRLTQADLYRDYHKTSRMLLQGDGVGRDANAALMVAELELTIGNYEGAQNWLETARRMGAPAQRLAAAEAWTWYALGDVAKGDVALAAAGGEHDARANLARAGRALRTRNLEEALKWVRRAVADGPNERNFLHRAADVHALMGDTDSAAALRLRAATAGLP